MADLTDEEEARALLSTFDVRINAAAVVAELAMQKNMSHMLYADDEPPKPRPQVQLDRPDGFYWVRDRGDDGLWREWRVDEWQRMHWLTAGFEEWYAEDPDEVGPETKPPQS